MNENRSMCFKLSLRLWRLIFFAIIAVLPGFARAQEVRSFFSGARSLAMGGAQINIVDDETALLSNPAGLGKLRNVYGTIFDPEIDISTNDIAMQSANAFSDPFDPSQISSAVNGTKNTYYHARAQIFPSIVLRNFGFGIFVRKQLDMLYTSSNANPVSTYYWQDAAVLLGYNIRFFDGRIKIGVTGKAIDRVEISKAAMAYPNNFTIASNATEGAGVGADAGIILSAPWDWLPSISAVVRDIGGMQFTAGKNIGMTTTGIPNPVAQDIDAAVAVFPIISNRTRTSFTFEEQKMVAMASSADPSRYYHYGTEFNFSDLFYLRGGMNGHWWTAGIELSSEHFQFQATTYGEDVGIGANVVEDRRYVAKIAFRF